MSFIYEPSDDSYLLSKVLEKEIPALLEKNPTLNFLEMGCGSGIQLKKAKELGVKNILGVDLNEDAINHCKDLKFNTFKSNLFERIKEQFDLIIFNPPYLPIQEGEDNESQIATTGGKKGSEIINKFLIQAKDHLNKNGIILLLTSSLTKEINWLNFKKELVAEKKLFMEELFVWKLKA
jgi:release factor glutamine methyltransferase